MEEVSISNPVVVLGWDVEEIRALGDDLSDIGRFSLTESPWRGNSFTFPLPTLASFHYGSLPPLLGLLKASCDQGDTLPWIPQQRFSATLLFFEGTRQSRARGLFEKAQASGF